MLVKTSESPKTTGKMKDYNKDSEINSLAISAHMGCKESGNDLYLKVKPIIWSVIRQFLHIEESDELWGCANLAFSETLSKFDGNGNYPFIAFLIKNVRYAILKNISSTQGIHIPINLYYESLNIIKWIRINCDTKYIATEKNIKLGIKALGYDLREYQTYLQASEIISAVNLSIDSTNDESNQHAATPAILYVNEETLSENMIPCLCNSQNISITKLGVYEIVERVFSLLPDSQKKSALGVIEKYVSDGIEFVLEKDNKSLPKNIKPYYLIEIFKQYCDANNLSFKDIAE